MRSPDLRGDRKPVSGNRGYYRIFSYAYHPSIGFAVNCIILISNAASLAGVALIGAEYIVQGTISGTARYLSHPGDHRHQFHHPVLWDQPAGAENERPDAKPADHDQNWDDPALITPVFLSLIPGYPGNHPVGRSGPERIHPCIRYRIGGGIFYIRGLPANDQFRGRGQQPFEKHTQGIFLGILIIILLLPHHQLCLF